MEMAASAGVGKMQVRAPATPSLRKPALSLQERDMSGLTLKPELR